MKPRYGCKARAPPRVLCDFRRPSAQHTVQPASCVKSKQEKIMKTNTGLHTGLGGFIDGLG